MIPTDQSSFDSDAEVATFDPWKVFFQDTSKCPLWINEDIELFVEGLLTTLCVTGKLWVTSPYVQDVCNMLRDNEKEIYKPYDGQPGKKCRVVDPLQALFGFIFFKPLRPLGHKGGCEYPLPTYKKRGDWSSPSITHLFRGLKLGYRGGSYEPRRGAFTLSIRGHPKTYES